MVQLAELVMPKTNSAICWAFFPTPSRRTNYVALKIVLLKVNKNYNFSKSALYGFDKNISYIVHNYYC